jgi:hypothetical protein
MTAAGPLAFPGSRVLAGWWPQLAPLRPRKLWAGHFLLHRVEALVEVSRPVGLDPFHRLVLQALDLVPQPTVPALDAQLHLGPQFLSRVLHGLRADGLAEQGGAGAWQATALARQALHQGSYEQVHQERQVFHFLNAPRRAAPPFLDVRRPAAAPCAAPEGWAFDPAQLDACVRQPLEWKRQRGFPEEVRQVLGVRGLNGSVPPAAAWQQVVVDQPEHLLAVVALVPAEGEGERLLGFGVKQEGWALQGGEPAFAVGGGWQELFPGLAEELPADAWRQAWRAWCQQRGLPAAEADASTLEPHEQRLRVQAPAGLLARLRAARSDALKREAWLLVGGGNVRRVALLEVVQVGA